MHLLQLTATPRETKQQNKNHGRPIEVIKPTPECYRNVTLRTKTFLWTHHFLFFSCDLFLQS